MASGPFPATCFRRPPFSLGQPAKKDVSSPAPASGTPPLPQRSHAVRRLLRRNSWRLAFHLGSPFSATGDYRINIRLENQTILHEFFLLGFSDFLMIQYILFLLFSSIYLMTLTGNLLILVLIHNEVRLHTPMYFFLGNLACLDAGSSSVTVPRMLADLLTEKRTISLTACRAQVFFIFIFATSEIFLLAVMSYDRYVAICHPLHYNHVMSWDVCAQMASVAWMLGFSHSLIQTLCTHMLTFCGPNIIQSFFCELPLLLQLSCTDTFINILVIFLAALILGLLALGFTFIPYIQIFRTILGIPTKEGKHKAFSTCASHLSVVFIFYGTCFFTYLRPTPSHPGIGDTLVSVIYTVINPLLNPFIYSLRNKELKGALRNTLHKHFHIGTDIRQNFVDTL
ncbi:olfactory receptor 1G1-like isoform X1 [Ascaphus truei]|uniref:olfactory receptor 1G1-like isoform X1 n=1 Tax=Ascaphus truei TaxID=8439 RepID=UPI003F5A5151